jgi:hypothetical protein
MLGRLVDAAGGRLTTVSTSMLVAELIARIEQERPAAVCIAVLPPGGLHRARSVCKRLRATVSGLRIIVLRPRADLDEEESAPRLREAGADAVARSLAEAVAEIEPLLGALHQRDEERVAASL